MDITETSKLVTSAFEKSSSDRMRRFDSDAETVQSFCAIFDSSPLGSLQDKLTKHEETSFSGQHYVDTGAVTRKRVKRADSDDLRGEVRKLDLIQRLQWLVDIAEGLKWLHDNEMSHGNVQLSNVILYHPNSSNRKLNLSRAKLTDMWVYRCLTKQRKVQQQQMIHASQFVVDTIDRGRDSKLSSVKWIPPEFCVAERRIRRNLLELKHSKTLLNSAPKQLKFWVKRTQSGLSKKKNDKEEKEDTTDHSIGLQCLSPAVDAYGMGKILELLTHGLKQERSYADLRSVSISEAGSRRSLRRSRGISAQNVFSSVVGYSTDEGDIEDAAAKVLDFKELRRATKRCLRSDPDARPSIAAVLGKLRKVYEHVRARSESSDQTPVGSPIAQAAVTKNSDSSGEEFEDAVAHEDHHD